MIGDIEQALIARLAQCLPGLAVEPFPDNPDNYRLMHPKGAVLVNYQGSDYGTPRTTDTMAQDRSPEWDLTLQMRNLRGHAGAYPVIDAIRLAVQGWGQAETGGAFWMVGDRFVDVAKGIWVYRVTVKHKLLAVPAVSAQTLAEADATPATAILARNHWGEELIIERNLNG